MGIKFYCPNGHKVNVKSFLAGKKGLCPKCGVRVDIPLHSVAKNQSTAVLSTATGTAADDDDTEDLIQHTSAGHHTAAAAPPTLSLLMEQPPVDESHRSSESSLPTALALHSPPGEENLALSEMSADQSVGANNILPPAAPEAVVPAVAYGVTWYVQPASGQQQFGPVDDATLQHWLAEGRIHPNDMIWREGWSQWQSIMAVFPQLHANHHDGQSALVAGDTIQANDPLSEALQHSQPAATSTDWLRQRHRGKRQIRARLSLVLLGMVVLLFALLLYVFFMRQQPPEQKETTLLTKPGDVAAVDI
jgi:hypothetical protein